MNESTFIPFFELKQFILSQPDEKEVDTQFGVIAPVVSGKHTGCVLCHYAIKEGVTSGFAGISFIDTQQGGYELSENTGKFISYLFKAGPCDYKGVKELLVEWENNNESEKEVE